MREVLYWRPEQPLDHIFSYFQHVCLGVPAVLRCYRQLGRFARHRHHLRRPRGLCADQRRTPARGEGLVHVTHPLFEESLAAAYEVLIESRADRARRRLELKLRKMRRKSAAALEGDAADPAPELLPAPDKRWAQRLAAIWTDNEGNRAGVGGVWQPPALRWQANLAGPCCRQDGRRGPGFHPASRHALQRLLAQRAWGGRRGMAACPSSLLTGCACACRLQTAS
jgi:hypothetical protein